MSVIEMKSFLRIFNHIAISLFSVFLMFGMSTVAFLSESREGFSYQSRNLVHIQIPSFNVPSIRIYLLIRPATNWLYQITVLRSLHLISLVSLSAKTFNFTNIILIRISCQKCVTLYFFFWSTRVVIKNRWHEIFL